MSASIYPASLAQKGNGYRFQAWCHEHQDGLNTKTRAQARSWCTKHNTTVEHAPPSTVPGPLYSPRPGRTYEPRTAPDTTPKDSDATD